MENLIKQLATSGFSRILIISSMVDLRRSMAMSLLKLLPRPTFSAIDPAQTTLPDRRFDWSAVDLVFVDLSGDSDRMLEWYAGQADSVSMPPAILVDNKASVDDAGDAIRAGAVDYIDLAGLRMRRLARGILIAAEVRDARARVVKGRVDPSRAEILRDDTVTEVVPVLTPAMIQAMEQDTQADSADNSEDDAPSFLTSGLMDILKRHEVQQALEREKQENGS